MRIYRVTLVVSFGLLQFAVACSPPDGRESDEMDRAACGQLAVWNLPEGMEVSSPDLDSAWVDNQRAITLARLNLVVLGAESFCLLRGRYPTDLPELLLASTDGSLPPRCSMFEELLTDWWGHSLRYEPEPAVVVSSSGEDGIFGTVDDLRSPRRLEEDARQVDVEAECGRS
jgi:hypothetical protein